MSAIVDVPELFAILAATPRRQNILLVGRHGLGKSEILRHYFEREAKLPVTSFFLGQMSDPGDLIGLPHANPTTGRTDFLPPFWWPTDARPVALFLDELNRARPELLQAVQDLTLNRTLAGRRLPEGSVVVAAVNDGEDYQITDLDPALVSRFNVYTFRPTVDDWIVWANETSKDARVVSFIQENPGLLDGDGDATAREGTVRRNLERTPDRRAWARVAEVLGPIPDPSPLHFKLIAGIVGARAALLLRQHLGRTAGLTVDDVLFGTAKERKRAEKLAIPELALLNEQILHYLEAGRCPSARAEDARRGLLDYLVRLEKTPNKREALGHMASLFEAPRFHRALAFVAASKPILAVIERFIEGIHTP